MSVLFDIMKNNQITLFDNSQLDLDRFYPEPYQDAEDVFMGPRPFETNTKKCFRNLGKDNLGTSNFSFFMDGSRRTYKIGDMIYNNCIYPIVAAQVRAGCTKRDRFGYNHLYGEIKGKNLILISDRLSDRKQVSLKEEIENSKLGKSLDLEVMWYDGKKDINQTFENKAISKANAEMHALEIELLRDLVTTQALREGLLIVDGPLQFLVEDKGTTWFADLFVDVVGVSKCLDPTLPVNPKKSSSSQQIGVELLKLELGERTPVFYKRNSNGRKFGFWYLRIKEKSVMPNQLAGIIKIEKMAIKEEEEGLDSDKVDNISRWLLTESFPTCYGIDQRWPNHLYPVYITERIVKSSFINSDVFMSSFLRNFD